MIEKVLILFFVFLNVLEAKELVEYEVEYDIYYSNVSAYIDLDTANEMQDASDKHEKQIYKELLAKMFEPNIFLAELAVHPMPILGVYLKSKQKDMYRKIPFAEAVTAGFDEPYSLSFFFGRMMVFSKEDISVKNRAFIGYLFTIGDYTIKDNIVHYNRWLRVEFKLKGTRNKKHRDLDWSFRVGAQINQNEDFANTLYVGAKRSSIDYKKSIYSFLNNSAFENLIEVDYSFHLVKAEFIYEKKIPLGWMEKLTFSLGVGYLYDSFNKFRGALKERQGENHQLIIRPNLTF